MRNQRGFTYVELILYVAIVTIIVSALTPFTLEIIGGGIKSSNQQELSSQARYVSERLKYEIRNAQSINTGTSNFGVDLAGDSARQLSLAEAVAGNNPTIFNVVAGKLMIKRGAAAAVALNSEDSRVTSLIFTSYASADNKTKNIQFVITIDESVTTTRQEYQNPAVTIQSSAELRLVN